MQFSEEEIKLTDNLHPSHRCKQGGQLEQNSPAHGCTDGQDRDDQDPPELLQDGRNETVDIRQDGARAGQEEQEARDPARVQEPRRNVAEWKFLLNPLF